MLTTIKMKRSLKKNTLQHQIEISFFLCATDMGNVTYTTGLHICLIYSNVKNYGPTTKT